MNETIQKVKLLPNTGQANSTIFVLGATGCGKTTLIANLLGSYSRFFIFDTKQDYEVTFWEDAVICDDFGVFVTGLNNGFSRIIFDASSITEIDEQENELDKCLQVIYQFQLANKANDKLPPICVVLDELNKFIEGQTACKGLQQIIQQGRGVKIQKIFGAQWFGRIPTWVRDSFTETYVFTHFDGAGLQRLEEYGYDSELVRTLPEFTCIHGKKNIFKQIRLEPVANGSVCSTV